jgi:hypothetical protein
LSLQLRNVPTVLIHLKPMHTHLTVDHPLTTSYSHNLSKHTTPNIHVLRRPPHASLDGLIYTPPSPQFTTFFGHTPSVVKSSQVCHLLSGVAAMPRTFFF